MSACLTVRINSHFLLTLSCNACNIWTNTVTHHHQHHLHHQPINSQHFRHSSSCPLQHVLRWAEFSKLPVSVGLLPTYPVTIKRQEQMLIKIVFHSFKPICSQSVFRLVFLHIGWFIDWSIADCNFLMSHYSDYLCQFSVILSVNISTNRPVESTNCPVRELSSLKITH